MPTLFSAPEPLEGKVGVNYLGNQPQVFTPAGNGLNGIYVGTGTPYKELFTITKDPSLVLTPDTPVSNIQDYKTTSGASGGAAANNQAADSASQWSLKEKIGVGAIAAVLAFFIYKEIRA